jgi:hypothetical protein
MRTQDEIREALRLGATGETALSIARATGIPRSTVRTWLSGQLPRGPAVDGCPRCGGDHAFEAQPAAYVYLLGLYLGDGCISAHRRGVYRLRLFFDARYPRLLEEGAACIAAVFPSNRIGRLARSGSYATSAPGSNIEISMYSKTLPCLFPQHGAGRKHERRIELTDWQWSLVSEHPELLLKGLIHSDGCRFVNTGRKWRHPRYSFSNKSDDIRAIFCDTCDLIGVHWTVAPNTVYVSRVRDVAVLDGFIGPKT